MTTETIETPASAPETPQADPEVPQSTETETPATESVAESAAPDAEAAAAELQVEVEKPNYVTREELEAERTRAAAEALELDRRRRQTENARRATQEKRDIEERAELSDTVKAAFAAKGIFDVPDDAITTAIDRVARKRADFIGQANLDTVEQALEFITAPAYGQSVDLEEGAEPAARRLAPKIQSLIDTIRPQIEAKAREGYIAESELPARVDAEIARRNAKGREGQSELQRPEGQPANSGDEQVWWSGLTPEGRRDPANIARFDRYTARR